MGTASAKPGLATPSSRMMTESFRSPGRVVRRLKRGLPAIRKIRNWPSFLLNYALGLKPGQPYRFRNGASLELVRGIDHAPIVEVFLNEEYGHVPDDAVIVDIGANIGTFTVYALTTARGVRVYAYEPDGDFYEALLQNLDRNAGHGTARAFNLAVAGDDKGRDLYLDSATFFFPTLVQPANAPAGKSVHVGSITLEQIMKSNGLDRIDLLKMDCEGAEYEILYSCSSIHLGRISEIRMEYHDLDADQQRVEVLARRLEGNGFVVTRLRQTSETNGNLWAQRRDLSPLPRLI